jgi:hypothetical protein
VKEQHSNQLTKGVETQHHDLGFKGPSDELLHFLC